MHALQPLPDDSELLFLRSAAAGKSAVWMLIGGVLCVLAGLLGFATALVASVDPLQLHLMTTAPMIAGVGLLLGGWSLSSAPRQVAVGPRGIAIDGRTRQSHAWEQIGWATVGVPGMGGRRVLSIYDTRGKTLATISDAFENFDVLVDLVTARVAARADDAASRIQAGKSRRNALVTLGTGAALLAASIGIAAMTRYEQRSEQVLAAQGTPGEGEIVRRFLAPNGVTPRLEYRVKTPSGDALVRNAELERPYWDSLASETTVPIILVPDQPDVSRLARGEVQKQDFLKTPLGGYGLAGLGGLMSLLLVGAGVMQLNGWDIDLDSKTGKVSIKRFGLAVWPLVLLWAVQAQADDAPRPTNVVLIVADDLGWGDLGCYGQPRFKTPHLDRMAAEGARLTNFYAPCPFCAPTRASLLTGRYPFRSGMNGNPAPDGGVNDLGIHADELLLSELFQKAGYATACHGKWHLGHRPEFFPTRHGFDEYFGILYSNDMRPVELRQNEERLEYPVAQATLTRRYTERALAFIDQHRDRPFFLYLPHAMPHKPLAASEAFYGKSGAGLYGDVLAELDDSVGQVLTRLKQLQLDERTLVLFTSDNGPWYGGSSGNLRGMKGQNWEGGLRVPLIARWSGKVPAGSVSHEPAIMMDLFATALAAAGLEPPADRPIDGRNLLPLFASAAKSPHDALFSVQGKNLSTIRVGHWKLHPRGTPRPDNRRADWVDPRAPDGETILAPDEQYRPSDFPGLKTGDTSTGPALFDLASDPGEQQNVAAANPEVVSRLAALFEKMAAEAANSQPGR